SARYLSSFVLGLSPLARGNLAGLLVTMFGNRSIPARAGEPDGIGCDPHGIGVYPRSRGGTFTRSTIASFGLGLSPLARGNRRRIDGRDPRPGSIPARAGEPLRWVLFRSWLGVYPRSRGGTGIKEEI